MSADPSSSEITQLRRRLRAFVSQAKENERKLGRLHEFEIRLISASGLRDLLQVVLEDYRESAQLQAVGLLLVDDNYEIRHLLDETGIDEQGFPGLRLISTRSALARHEETEGVWMGLYDREIHPIYFPDPATPPLESIALLPLVRGEHIIGYFTLGSSEPGRYIAGAGSAFLERMARFIAVCIENAINHEKVKRLGLVDALTGVYNRRYFDQRLHEEVQRALRARGPVSCLYLDIDHFKKINDNWGHGVGDSVLRQVAETIRRQLRGSDVLARYGGEEFVLLLADTGETLAAEIAERIRAAIAREEFATGGEAALVATISIGIATLADFETRDADAAAQSLLKHADQALYHAKHKGRNRCEKHSS